jgi:hypothetical protein
MGSVKARSSSRKRDRSRSPQPRERETMFGGRRKSPAPERGAEDAAMSDGKGGRQKGKGKGKGKEGKGSEDEQIEVLTLLLKTAATVSRHQSYLVHTFLVPKTSHIAERGLEAEQSYKEKTKTKGHGLGKPDTYIFFRLLDEAQIRWKSEGAEPKPEFTIIEKFFEGDKYHKPKEYVYAHAISQCRASQTFKGDLIRISMRINVMRPDGKTIDELAEVIDVLMRSITEDGGYLTDGPPPKSATERNIQKAIEKHYRPR